MIDAMPHIQSGEQLAGYASVAVGVVGTLLTAYQWSCGETTVRDQWGRATRVSEHDDPHCFQSLIGMGFAASMTFTVIGAVLLIIF